MRGSSCDGARSRDCYTSRNMPQGRTNQYSKRGKRALVSVQGTRVDSVGPWLLSRVVTSPLAAASIQRAPKAWSQQRSLFHTIGISIMVGFAIVKGNGYAFAETADALCGFLFLSSITWQLVGINNLQISLFDLSC